MHIIPADYDEINLGVLMKVQNDTFESYLLVRDISLTQQDISLFLAMQQNIGKLKESCSFCVIRLKFCSGTLVN
jgi:hypothetical protein